MIRRTLSQIRSECARVAYTSGLNTSDDAVLSRINRATEELMTEGDWPGVVDRYAFKFTKANNGHIFLPYFLERILGITFDGVPEQLKSPWYEFVAGGPGPTFGCTWLSGLIDRDDSAIQVIFPGTGGPWTLYALSPNSDPNIVNVQGLYQGEIVRSLYAAQWIDGVNLDFTGVGVATPFDAITSISKSITAGYVEIWATNGDPTQDVLLANLAPAQQTTSFRCYYLAPQYFVRYPSDNHDVACLVRARKRFVPLANPNDLCPIANISAMVAMVQAIQKREVSDYEGAEYYKNIAINILKKEGTSFLGPIRTPVMTIAPGASVGDYSYFR